MKHIGNLVILSLFLVSLIVPVQALETGKPRIIPGNFVEDIVLPNFSSSENITGEEINTDFVQEKNLTAPIPFEEGNVFSADRAGNDSFKAGSDMVAYAFTETIPRSIGDSIFERFGSFRGWLTKFYTYNIKPWEIPIVKDFCKNNKLLCLPLIFLFLGGFTLARNVAIASPLQTQTVFGQTDWAYRDTIAGGLFMVIGSCFEAGFYILMLILDYVNLYLMFSVMESVEPSIDNAGMYFCMALISALLFIAFVYRQCWIVAGYAFAPFYGVMFAAGLMKGIIDPLGEMFLRAIIMQPACIAVTVIWIITMFQSLF